MIAGGQRSHHALLDERGQKFFAVVGTTDRASQQNSGAITAVAKVDLRGLDGVLSGKPGEFVAARTAPGRAKGGQVVSNFANRHRAADSAGRR